MSKHYNTQILLIANNISLFFGSVSTATYLAAYIVDLTLVLYGISTVVIANPPKSLSPDLVMKALAIYKSRSSHIHAQVKEVPLSVKLEEKIVSVIRDEVNHHHVRHHSS